MMFGEIRKEKGDEMIEVVGLDDGEAVDEVDGDGVRGDADWGPRGGVLIDCATLPGDI